MPRELPATTGRLRALGAVESAMAVLHELQGTTQTASLVQLSGPLTPALLQNAAAHLQYRHPLLQAVIAEQDGALYFMQAASMPPIALRVVAQEPTGQWRAELERELNEPLDPNHALWKLALLQDNENPISTLILTCHHALVDAVSLVALLSECLQLADALHAGQPLPLQTQALARPLDAYLHPPASAPLHLRLEGPQYAQAAALAARHTAVWYDQFDAQQVEHMQHCARSLGISLNSWLAAALLLASHQIGLGEQLRINTAVSLRQRTEPAIGDDALGCYIRVAPCELALAGRSMTSVAREYHFDLARQLENAHATMPPPDLPQLRANAARLAEGACFAQGIALTNHGRIQFPAFQHFNLVHYLNVAHRVAGNFAVALHVTTFEQQLCLSFTHVWPLISTDSIIRLQAAMRTLLLSRPEPIERTS
jgi:hypothetical protein